MTDLIITERENLVAIADAVRSNIGESKEITIGEIVEGINYLGSNVSLDTSDATATSSDILNGKTAYVDGKKVTGNIATKTSSDLTASGATVTVPAGYYDSQATKSVSTATQATPSITINSNGFIVASATQTAGYVNAGTKTTTKQLTAQPAKTVVPSTSSQTAVASGVYTTGTVTVAGDTNLVAENIAEGKTIFGVTGTHSGGNGGIDTSDATASADKIFLNETAYVNDEKVTGTFTIDSELTTQDNLITQIQTALANKATGVVLPELTNPATAENLEEGYELIDSDGNIVVGTHVCESGSGGGDGGVDVCTITVSADESYCALGIRIEDGLPVPIYYQDTSIEHTWSAPCGSMVIIAYDLSDNKECSNVTYCGLDDGTYAAGYMMGMNNRLHKFRINAQAGEHASIYMYEF